MAEIESCPLLRYPSLPFIDRDMPEICLERCGRLIDNSLSTGDYDCYVDHPLNRDDECAHDGDLEYSHNALVALNAATRHFVTVDLCSDCGEEYGESSRVFQCPNNGS